MEVNAAQGHALLTQFGGQVVESQDFVLVVAFAALNHGLHLLVCVSAARLDDGLANPAVVNLGFVVHLEDHAEGQFFLIRTERTDVVAEFFGQHWNSAVDQINRSATIQGFFVDGRAGTDIVRHVGDMHAHLPMAVGQFLQTDGIVEVFRIGGVDGDGEHRAEVAAFFYLVPADFGGNLTCLFFNLFGKFYRVLMGGQDAFHFHIVLAGLAQHTCDFAERIARAIGPIHKAGDDLLAVFRAVQVASRNENINWHPIHIGADINIAMRNAQHAHEVGVAAFQHLHDFAFGLRIIPFREHGHTHAVAMQCLVSVVGGDENVLAVFVVANDVGLARRFHFHRAFHIFRLRPKLRHAFRAHHITERPFLAQQAFVIQVDKQVVDHILARLVLDAHDFADLFVVLRAERLVGENAQNHTRKSAQFILNFLLFRHNDSICWAQR